MKAIGRFLAAAAGAAILLASAAVGAGDGAPAAVNPYNGMRTREEVFEFTQKPAVRKIGRDRYEITFASKGRCDAAVAIEDAKGKILRHLVCGVLGANAPEPLKKDVLEQTLVWDGKDDRGKYVRNPEACRVRVSLGLKPTFDKVLGWHPKDTVADRNIGAIAADKDGVYVLELSCSGRNQLKMFDHDGNYVRTLFPFAGDKVNTSALNIPLRKVELSGRTVPQLEGIGGIQPFDAVGNANSMAVASGRIGFFNTGVHQLGNQRYLLRFRTDGTTGGEECQGALFRKGFRSCTGQAHMALSPDGKWVYVTGLTRSGRVASHSDRGPYHWNSVFRFRWDRKPTDTPLVDKNSFVGEIGRDLKAGTGAGNDERHLNRPEGLACDAKGRLYVCDTGNNRIQVFSSDAKLVKSIPVREPQEIAIHQKTGEIYVFCFRRQKLGGTGEGVCSGQLTLVKLGPAEEAKERFRHVFTLHGGDARSEGFVPVFCVDSWSEPARIWAVARRRGRLEIYEDRGKGLEPVQDFEKEVERAGLAPHMLGGNLKNMLEVDPVRGHLYYLRCSRLMRCDPEGPGRFVPIDVMGSGGVGTSYEDMDFSLDGLLHLRQLRFLARFDPERITAGKNGLALSYEAEVPFDYGETQKLPWRAREFRGVLKVNAMPGANSFDTGIGVAPNGDIVAFMKNYQDYKTAHGMAIEYVEMPKMREDRYRPKTFPGRFWTFGELVMRWDSRGEIIGEDLIPALPAASCGIKTDRRGNMYVGVGANMLLKDGKPHHGGALAKFPPSGGKVYGKGDLVKLKEFPGRPAEFQVYGWGKLWAKNMFWAYPGLDQMVGLGNPYPCLCATCRFDLDLYGRSFVPKAYQYTVGVVDTNGNRICEIGRYGNADTRGPKDSTVKIGGPEIAIAHCSFVATQSDRWLYINDSGNSRLIRVKLGYHAEETAPLP